MEPFNLEKWLKNKGRKIITRDGRSVRIVCWDSPNKAFPIVGFINNNPTVFVWDNYGYSSAGHVESKNDLFFANEEEDEFETTMISFSHAMFDYLLDTTNMKVDVKEWKNKLIDLAKKELLEEVPMWKKITKKEQNYLAYGYLSNDEYYLSIQELKDKLPKEE